MKPLRHTLISDGPSDANLIPIIDWTLREAGILLPQGVRAEFRTLPKPPRNLEDRIIAAAELFPCEVLFIHRDAERDPLDHRHTEIMTAVSGAEAKGCRLPAVNVVPVRMSEAWLLFDEGAIRQAAGNPNGRTQLNLPPLRRIESRPDPKEDLRTALEAASELTGRRLKKFNAAQAFWRVVDFVDDFSPLRQLPAYLTFESSVRRAMASNWAPGCYGLVRELPPR